VDSISLKVFGVELAGSGTLGVAAVIVALVIIAFLIKPPRGRL
jgi:hypothetical protein